MNLNKQSIDRYLTTEPDNGYTDWIEAVWDIIPENIISGDDRDSNEAFFSYWEDKLSTAGRDGFVIPQFAAEAIMMRFRFLSSLKQNGWQMESPDCWTKGDKKLSLSVAYEYQYDLTQPKQ